MVGCCSLQIGQFYVVEVFSLLPSDRSRRRVNIDSQIPLNSAANALPDGILVMLESAIYSLVTNAVPR